MLVCWADASWRAVSSLIDEGALPNLSRLVESGVIAALNPALPAFTDSLYATAVTGVSADHHGILNRADVHPRTGKLCAPLSETLRSKPVWEVLGQQGMSSVAVGTPLLYPIRSFPGRAVSRELLRGMRQRGKPWMQPPGTAFPGIGLNLVEHCLWPEELTATELVPFLPDLAQIDQKKDFTARKLATSLSQTASLHAVWMSLIENADWQFGAVAPFLLEAAHNELRRGKHERQEDLIRACYVLLDQMLGATLRAARESVLTIVFSPRGTDGEPGFLVIGGCGTREDELLHGAKLVDIASTVLYALGSEVPRQMQGRPLTNAFTDGPSVRVSDIALRFNGEQPQECRWIAELEQLGYRDPAGAEATANQARVARERTFQLAELYLTSGRHGDAISLLEKQRHTTPDDPECALKLCCARLLSGDLARCRELIREVPERGVCPYARAVVRAYLAADEGFVEEAIDLLRKAEAGVAGSALIGHAIGCLYLDLRQFGEAESVFRRVTEQYRDCWPAHEGRAKALRALGRLHDAANALRESVQSNFISPQSHTNLAFTLLAIGDTQRAANAFRVAQALT